MPALEINENESTLLQHAINRVFWAIEEAKLPSAAIDDDLLALRRKVFALRKKEGWEED